MGFKITPRNLRGFFVPVSYGRGATASRPFAEQGRADMGLAKIRRIHGGGFERRR
jgi:hypothetical protein